MFGIGAIGGAVTSLVSEGFKVFKEKEERKHELELLSAKVESDSIEAYTKALVSAREHDAAITNTSSWVADLRASLRPFVTYYALVVATIFFFTGGEEIKSKILASFLLLLEAVVSFWFTGRAIGKK